MPQLKENPLVMFPSLCLSLNLCLQSPLKAHQGMIKTHHWDPQFG